MKYFADIHCHPTLKAYGHSFPGKENSKNLKSKSSVWYYDPPNLVEKMIDLLGGIVKYRQSDFSALGYGNAGIVFASLYPMERGLKPPPSYLFQRIFSLLGGLEYLKAPALHLFRGMSEQKGPVFPLLGSRGYLKDPASSLLGGREYLKGPMLYLLGGGEYLRGSIGYLRGSLFSKLCQVKKLQ